MRSAQWSAGFAALALVLAGCSSAVMTPPADARFGAGDFAVEPSPVWRLDASALGTVTHGLPYALPSASVAEAPMLFGLTNGDYSKSPRGLRVVALDPSTGERLWLRDIGAIRQCAEQIDDTVLACYGDHRVVYLDVMEGRVLGDIATDFYVYHVRAANGVGYVSGRSDDMLESDIYSGTFTELDTYWHSTFDSPTAGQPASPGVFPDRGIADVYSSGAHLIVDIETGKPRFRFTGENPLPVGNDLFVNVTRSPDGSLDEVILDGTGRVRTAVPVPTAGLSPTPWPNLGDDDVPLFLGDGAYDAHTGAELWRNPAMLENNGGLNSAVLAVVGETVIVRSSEMRTLTGIDASTGAATWTIPWQDAYWVRGGVVDDEHFVFGDYAGMHAIRASDGQLMWSVRWPPGVDPREMSVGSAAGVLTVSDREGATVWTFGQ